jgi:radical SAM protein with 4Fe4S-binding SPASM domain
LGKFNWNIPEFINNQKNTYYREDYRPGICQTCDLKYKCDGSCRQNYQSPETLKQRCEAIKELFEYVQTLKR